MTKKIDIREGDGIRAAYFDAFREIGGFLEDCGRSFSKSAIYFPATREWMLDDLTGAKAACERAIAFLEKYED